MEFPGRGGIFQQVNHSSLQPRLVHFAIPEIPDLIHIAPRPGSDLQGFLAEGFQPGFHFTEFQKLAHVPNGLSNRLLVCSCFR